MRRRRDGWPGLDLDWRRKSWLLPTLYQQPLASRRSSCSSLSLDSALLPSLPLFHDEAVEQPRGLCLRLCSVDSPKS